MKMQIHKGGDKGNALCETCQGKVATTYQRRDVPLSDGSATVPNVLVGVCDTCDSVVTLPHQSVPRVSQVVHKERKGLEARIPAHMKDMLLMVYSELHQSERFEGYIVRYYLDNWGKHHVPVSRVKRYLRSDLFIGKANCRLTVRAVDPEASLNVIRDKVKEIKTNSMVFKTIALAAYEDVIERPKSKARKDLENIAAAVGH
jgi:hypothetical protein